ncbi:MAG: hypothetical protein NVS9B1_12300 [Candidatus Dormibacteraceae bacterium]
MRRAGTALAVTLLLAASCSFGGPPPGTVATVNGKVAPKTIYDILVKATEAEMQRAGVPLRSGDGRTLKVEGAALKGTVHDAVVEQVADERKVTATPAEVTAALQKMETALGGRSVLDQRLEASGLDRQEFATLYHYTLLEQKMREKDPGYDKEFAKRLAAASVQAYVGPCASDHEYPRCLGEP